jgi:hypothetical protein
MRLRRSLLSLLLTTCVVSANNAHSLLDAERAIRIVVVRLAAERPARARNVKVSAGGGSVWMESEAYAPAR